jgi:hypothetical protein
MLAWCPNHRTPPDHPRLALRSRRGQGSRLRSGQRGRSMIAPCLRRAGNDTRQLAHRPIVRVPEMRVHHVVDDVRHPAREEGLPFLKKNVTSPSPPITWGIGTGVGKERQPAVCSSRALDETGTQYPIMGKSFPTSDAVAPTLTRFLAPHLRGLGVPRSSSFGAYLQPLPRCTKVVVFTPMALARCKAVVCTPITSSHALNRGGKDRSMSCPRVTHGSR